MDQTSADPDRPLRDSEARQAGFSLPVPLSRRLDQLVDLAREAGVSPSRKDLLAALILDAPEAPDELLALYLRYGKAKARDARISDQPVANVLALERAKPGRRPRATY